MPKSVSFRTGVVTDSLYGKPILAAVAAVVLLCFAASATAGQVSGVVRNGTTGRPVGGAEVILIQLQGGMQPIATVKTDGFGRFHFVNPALGSAPMLLRVPYRGVLFHTPVPPGTTTADVQVFDPTTDASAIVVTTRAIVLQPKGSNLLVGEEFTIENQTHPPVAFYQASGTFAFNLPKGAQLNQVSAWGPSGMPIIQGTIDKGSGLEAISFAFQPGQSGVRASYTLPYASNQASIQEVSPYLIQQVLLVVPPGVQVSSEGFSPAGTEQGYNIFSRDSVLAGMPIRVTVSGTPSPAASADNSENASVNSRAEEGGEAVTTLPARLDSLRWVVVAGFAALFALGVIFLWRRPPPVTLPATQTEPRLARRAEKGVSASNEAGREVESGVRLSLDELKERLFRLELRHQAGTISDEDYARERQRTEKVLRELVKD